MPFGAITFCGLSVRDVRASLGWNDQAGSLSVSLVLDPANGDTVANPPIGTPAYFQLGAFRFGGLLQRFRQTNDPSGFPVYEATVTDPRELLRNAEVILSSYSGNTGGVANLFNVYGYYESTLGFGGSQVNEAGMPWRLALAGVLALANGAGGAFGGPLTYEGVSYGLDLSELPPVPDHYRIGPGNVNLLEAISLVCEESGVDYFVELVGLTVRVRTVSRALQPPEGTIIALANTNFGNVLRSEAGLESASGLVNSTFLVGAEVRELHQTDSLASFWGYDLAGNAIVGSPAVVGLANGVAVACEAMALNAQGVADIVGSVSYPCTTLEMRLAMASYEAWEAYVSRYRPDIWLALTGNVKEEDVIVGALQPSDDEPDAEAELAAEGAAVFSEMHLRRQRLFDFVRNYATDFYGKRFLASAPFVATRVDPDTLEATHSWEPTDSAWEPEGTAPLGLPADLEDLFSDPSGQFYAFVRVNADAADLSRGGEVVVAGDQAFVRAQVEPRLVFAPGPCVLLTLPTAVHDLAVDPQGDLDVVAAVLQRDPDELDQVLPELPVGYRVYPAARYPEAAALPMKSNTLCYGPWYAQGAPGKVRYEQDPSYAPWNFGSMELMNAAALARVSAAITSQTRAETGVLELVGMPLGSLGDALTSGGPQVTSVQISFGERGVTTAYSFQTFTPRFGQFARSNAERLKRASLAAVELRRKARALARDRVGAANVADAAFRGFGANLALRFRKQSPHSVLVARVRSLADGTPACEPATVTVNEAVPMLQAQDSSTWPATAAASLSALIRPFTTRTGNNGRMGAFATPSGAGKAATATTLNPFPAGNDVAVLSWGQACSGWKSLRKGTSDASDTRAFALRGPVVLTGWGQDLTGNWVPGETAGAPASGYARRADLWPTGPIDLRWDSHRGVWTGGHLLTGRIVGSGSGMALAPGGSGWMDVWDDTGSVGWQLPVFDLGGRGVSGVNSDVIAGYSPYTNRWHVLSCPSEWAVPASGCSCAASGSGGGSTFGLTTSRALVTSLSCSGGTIASGTTTFYWSMGLLTQVGSGTFSPSGVTGNYTVVTAAACSGTSLSVTTSQLVYVQGLLSGVL